MRRRERSDGADDVTRSPGAADSPGRGGGRALLPDSGVERRPVRARTASRAPRVRKEPRVGRRTESHAADRASRAGARAPAAAAQRDGARRRRDRCATATARRWSASASTSTTAGACCLRAVPAAAARGAAALEPSRQRARPHRASRAPEHARRAAPAGAPGVHYTRGPPWTPSTSRHDRPPARGGLRLPRGHREPPGVHRPLPQGLAPDARGLRRPRRRRALPERRAARPLRLGRPTFIEVEPPLRIVEVGRGGKFNRDQDVGEWTLEPARRRHDARRVRYETEPALPTDRLMEAFGRRAAGSSASCGKAPAAAAAILEEDRDARQARDDRRVIIDFPPLMTNRLLRLLCSRPSRCSPR